MADQQSEYIVLHLKASVGETGSEWVVLGNYEAPNAEEARALALAALGESQREDCVLVAVAKRWWKPHTAKIKVVEQLGWEEV